MASGTAVIPGVTSGSLDIGISNIGSLGAAYSHGLPIVLLAPGAVYDQKKQATALVVADPALKTAAGLAGKVIAVNGLHDLVMFATTAWLTQNGTDANAVKFVEMPFPEMPVAVGRGTVDPMHSRRRSGNGFSAIRTTPSTTASRSSSRAGSRPKTGLRTIATSRTGSSTHLRKRAVGPTPTRAKAPRCWQNTSN